MCLVKININHFESDLNYKRKSLQRFYDLLAPGGICILETLNAVSQISRIRNIAQRTGFSLVEEDKPRTQYEKYILDLWPTG